MRVVRAISPRVQFNLSASPFCSGVYGDVKMIVDPTNDKKFSSGWTVYSFALLQRMNFGAIPKCEWMRSTKAMIMFGTSDRFLIGKTNE